MFRKTLVAVMLLLLGALLYVPFVQAETKIDYGAAFRLRQENWDDVVNLSTSVATGGGKDRNFFRLRTQLWGKVDFNKDLGVYARLVNEAKYFDGPFFAYKNNPTTDRFDPDELDIDNLYVDAKNIFGLPIDVRAGRQDFLGPDMYGEGFLLMDGTPGDGSKTFYFNAIRAKLKISKDHSIDFVYINDPKTDTYFPSLHPAVTGGLFVDNKKLLTASHEEAFMVYGRAKVTENVLIEPYFIHKTEGAFGTTSELTLSTIGARVVANVNSWKFGGEFAHQFGDYSNGVDRSGNGGYLFVSRKYDNVGLKPEFDLRFVYLSGDKPTTSSKVEAWDPLFSRNPYWNELTIYTQLNETAKLGGAGLPGYWTNTEILKASLNLNFSPETRLNLAYQYLWAPQESGITTGALYSNNGKVRGHLPSAILSHKFSKNLDGMVQLEYFAPGNYYKAAADNATFFRWQLQFKI
ncbi:MAG: alginate export family protein [Thermodesulfovibrionales bacterium]